MVDSETKNTNFRKVSLENKIHVSSTEEALMSRQGDAKKVYITRAGCLRKCKNPQCMGVDKNGVL